MTAKRLRRRKIQTAIVIAVIFTALITTALVLLPKNFYQNYFAYTPHAREPISVPMPKIGSVDHSLDHVKAQAIPVIFYHGILADNKADDVNVTESNFVSQMVALKRAGYYTVTTGDLTDFYHGKTFYGKPILVSFDDGRLDSWIRGDDVLKKLGFKAVMYVVSGKQDNFNDPFFMSWGELEQLNASGRWELEAHGWYSHTKIPIDAAGSMANPLTDRKWLSSENRLETFTEADARILNDYQQNLLDLHNHFAKNNFYSFAVPYGDYGQKQNNFFNFPDADQLNYGICKAYFKLCMDVSLQPYNFPQHDPLRTQRLSVGAGWSGEDLLFALNSDYPKAPQYTLNLAQAKPPQLPTPYRLLGSMQQKPGGLLLNSVSAADGYMNLDLGNINSVSYTIKTTVQLIKGSSINLTLDKIDADNHLLFGVTGGEATLQEYVGGKQKTIKSALLSDAFDPYAQHVLKVSVKGYAINCWLDGRQVISNARFTGLEPHGQFGYDVWGAQGSQMLLKSLSVTRT